jgi:predicted acylesterase/phospholipase RssA
MHSEESMQKSPTAAATATSTVKIPSHGKKVTVAVVMFITACLVVWVVCVNAHSTSSPVRMHGHLLPPKHGRGAQTQIGPDGTTTTTTALTHPIPTDRTLRDFLTDSAGFHLAMAPSFFGFYGYFGALAAWEEGIDASILSPGVGKIHSVAGASAGAMAAILIAAGIKPRRAADFVSGMTLDKFADYPAIGAFLRGNKFEQIMFDFMRSEQPDMSLLLQDSILPVAVTAFDLQTMKGQILSRGSMARAARASATFPVLFQPVGWKGNETNGEDYILIDGGVTDWAGVDGLKVLFPDRPKRVVNLVVGDFTGSDGPPGPSAVPGSTEVLSISMQNLPLCSPFHMTNGPITVDAAHRAMMATLDLPLYKGREANHFELHIDTGTFWKGKKTIF